eukprot:6808873-Prymnesium_polylepis.1
MLHDQWSTHSLPTRSRPMYTPKPAATQRAIQSGRCTPTDVLPFSPSTVSKEMHTSKPMAVAELTKKREMFFEGSRTHHCCCSLPL